MQGDGGIVSLGLYSFLCTLHTQTTSQLASAIETRRAYLVTQAPYHILNLA